MTTQELKDYIDRVLGNSLRCMLPSYWWKRLFGLVLDKVDEVSSEVETKVSEVETKVADLPTKEYVDNAVSNVEIAVDSEMSESSTNAVQNKVITAALATKVDTVEGKQLSTEDFTTLLKEKLEGLNNYDDTEIASAINTLRSDFNTLVSGDTTTAIKSFKDIVAFLSNIEDSESLESIIAGIEQQIANKQDVISDLDTIRSGAALGATALQEHQDISHLATKEEVETLTEEVINNEEVTAAALADLDNRLNETNEYAKTLVLKTEFEEKLATLTEDVINNEEVTAAALVDLDNKINEILTKLNNAGL